VDGVVFDNLLKSHNPPHPIPSPTLPLKGRGKIEGIVSYVSAYTPDPLPQVAGELFPAPDLWCRAVNNKLPIKKE